MSNRIFTVLMVLVMVGSIATPGVVAGADHPATNVGPNQDAVDTVDESTIDPADAIESETGTLQSRTETIPDEGNETRSDPPDHRYTLINTTSGVSFSLAPGEALTDLAVPSGEYLVHEHIRTDDGERVETFTVVVADDGSVDRVDSDSGGSVETASHSTPDLEVRTTVGLESSGYSLEANVYPAGSTVNVSLSVANTSGRLPKPVGGTAVNVTIEGPNGQTVGNETVVSDSSGSVVVPINTSGFNNGQYEVYPTTSTDAVTYSTSFHVGPSVVVYPRFNDKAETNRTTNISVALSEQGSPVTNETVELAVNYRDGGSETVTVTTGEDGFGTVSFTPDQAGDYSIYPINRPGQGATVTAGDVLGQIRTNDQRFGTYMPAGENAKITGFVTDDGTPASNEDIVVRIVNETDYTDPTVVTNITTTTDAFGQYAVNWTTPTVPGGEYEARLFTADGTRIPHDGGRIDLERQASGGGGSTGPSARLDTELLAPGWQGIVAPGGTAEALVSATVDGEAVANAEVDYVLLYDNDVVADNGTVATNASGQATISIPVGADAPAGNDFEIVTVATLNNTTQSDRVSGRLQEYRINEDRLGADRPGNTVGFRVTVTDPKTGEGVSGVPMMVSGETMDSLHGSVFATGANVSTASGDATVEMELPDNAMVEYHYGPLYPYFDGGFPVEFIEAYDVTVNGVPDGEVEPGETITMNYTADAAGDTGAVVVLRTWEDGVEPVPVAKRVREGENVTFTAPAATSDTYYTIQVRAINQTGMTSIGDGNLRVNGSDTVDDPTPDTLVVDADGGVDYAVIQNAVDNASEGQTVEVRPGVYREQVVVEKNISLVAPDGATLNGSTFNDSYDAGISLRSSTSAHVSGFTIENYPVGVEAAEWDSDWTVTNATIVNNTVGVRAPFSLGNWTIVDTHIVNNTLGVQAFDTSGNWSIYNSTVRGSAGTATTETYRSVPGTGIYAAETTGAWVVHGSTLVNNSDYAINATGANPEGDARDNWWGNESGPDTDDCTGNVTCAESLTSPPEDGEDEGTVTYEVRNLTAPDTASLNEDVVVSARIVNTGNASGTQNVSFTYSGGTFGLGYDKQVSLAPGESTRVAFAFGAQTDTAGTYTATVATDNDSVATDVEFVDRRFKTGVSWGDPHFVTFDGMAYDFQGVGEFVLVREENQSGDALTIQVRQIPVAGSTSVSITNATATVVDGHRVEIDASESTPLHVNGTPQSLAPGNNVSVGDGEIRRVGDTYTVIYPGDDGVVDSSDERLQVDVIGDRLDLKVSLNPTRSEPVEGLLGTPNDNVSDDLAFANGTALDRPVEADALYGTFRDDWRVTENTSVFTYEDDRGPAAFYDANFPKQIVTLEDLNETVRQRGEELAREAGLEPGTPAFRNAVIDYALTGDSAYFASAQQGTTGNATSDASEPEPGDLDTAVELTPRNATTARNGTVTYEVVLTDAYGGVGAVEGTISVENATVGTVTNVSVLGGDGYKTVNITDGGASVYFDGALLNTTDRGGATIATVTVQGATPGQTTFDLSIDAVGNESGAEYNVTSVDDAGLNVTTLGPLRESYAGPPTDPDGDGLFEDINGDGDVNIVDVQALYTLYDNETVKNNTAMFNFNGDEGVTIVDVQRLYVEQQASAESTG